MAKKPTPAPVPTPAAPAWPKIGIVERRIASGRRTVLRPRTITLVNQPEPMTTYIVNTAIDSRWHQVTEELGWEPVRPHEVAGGLHGDMREADGCVVLGERGAERLVKMPTRLYQQIKRAAAQDEYQALMSKSKFKGRVKQALERDAKTADRPGAEQLERASELMDGTSRVAHLEVEQFEISKEIVPIRDAESA